MLVIARKALSAPGAELRLTGEDVRGRHTFRLAVWQRGDRGTASASGAPLMLQVGEGVLIAPEDVPWLRDALDRAERELRGWKPAA